MYVPMPTSVDPVEEPFLELLDNMDSVRNFKTRQKTVQRIEGKLAGMRVKFPLNAIDATAPENNVLDMVVACYLTHACKADNEKEQNYFVDCANVAMMPESNSGRHHDMNESVMAALPLMDPAKICTRHGILMRNLANIATDLPLRTKRELVEVTYRFNGLKMQPQDADELVLDGMEPLDAQSILEDLEHLIVGDEYLTTPTPRVQELRYV